MNADANGAGIKYFHANSTLGDSSAVGVDSVAIGPVATSSGASSVAIGEGAIATNAGDVALGSGSTTGSPTPVTGVTIAGTVYGFAGTNPTSVVSVGTTIAPRQITNVAAGQVSATSTDAINGSQLYAVDQAIASLSTSGLPSSGAGPIKGGTQVTSTAPVANSANALAAGYGAAASGASSVALGNQAMAGGSGSVVVGTGSTDNGVSNATVLGQGAGISSSVSQSSVALGQGSTVTGNVTGAASATVGGTVYTGFAGTAPQGTVSVGSAGSERTLSNVASGQVSATSTDAINGSQLYAVASTTVSSVSSLSTGLSSAGSAVSSLSTGVSTNASSIGSLSTSASSGISTAQSGVTSLSTGLSTTNSSVASLSTSTSSGISTATSSIAILNADANGAGIKYFHANSTLGDSNALGANSVAIGPVATSAGASSVAIGQGAIAATAGDVALGAGAVTAAANAPTTLTIGGVAYNLAGVASSVVSVGAPGAERQITNVAPGRVSAMSTDAVNGSQLYATDQAVTSALDHVSDFVSDSSLTTNLPTSSGVNATAGGLGAYAGGANSLVVGNSATDNGVANSTVLGEGASIASGLIGSNVAIGQGSEVTASAVGTAGVTIGGNVYNGFAGSNPAGVVSFGTASAPRVLTNVAAGAVSSTSTDAVNGSELYSVTEQVSQTANTVAGILGGGSTSASGAVTSPSYTVYGQTTTTVAQAVTALQQASPVQYASTSGAASGLSSPTNTVTLVGSNSTAPVTVTNVAAGTAPTDAVNVSQLQASEVHYFSVNNGTSANGGTSTTGGSSSSTGSSGSSTSSGPSNYNNTGATGAYSVAISQGATATAAGDVALGYNSTASGTSQGSAVSVGAQNTASGAGAVAIGDPLVAVGNGAVAMGQNDTATGNGAVALGEVSVANGDGSVAIGNVSTAAGTGSVALGNAAFAANTNDVALGSGSTTAAANPTSGIVIRGVTYAFAGSNPTSVVSVGAPGAERQITNVAAGQINATSTDAVNGSELYATNQAVQSIGSNVSSLGTSVTSLSTQVATLASSSTGLVTQQGGAPGNGAISVGANTGGALVSVSGTSGDRQITGVAAGTASNDAVNVGQLEAALGGATANAVQYDNASHNSVTLGGVGASSPVAMNNVAAGALSATSTQAVNGSQLYATNTNVTNLNNGAAGAFQVYQSGTVAAPTASGLQSTAGGDGAVASGPAATAIGYHATATGQNSVAIGANSTDGGQANVVSVGSPGNERRITNVAPGVSGTDAVNVNQLVAAENSWQQNINTYVAQANAGIALALASSGLHYDSAPGTTSLAGAASYYADHAGIAFGLNHTSADGRWRYNIATTFVSPVDGAGVGVVAGFSYTFGH